MLSGKQNFELTQHLKNIAQDTVYFDHEDAKKNAQIMQETVAALVEAMKEHNYLFRTLFQKIVYTGSFYEGIRIKDPDEFDLNFVLHLPFNAEHVKISHVSHPAEFVKFSLRYEIDDFLPISCDELRSFFNDDGYLITDDVLNWLYELMSKVHDFIYLPEAVQHFSIRHHGPAVKLSIDTNDGISINVDIVPVIDGNHLDPEPNGHVPFPPGFRKSELFRNLIPEAQVYYLVPKKAHLHRRTVGSNIALNHGMDAATMWRVAFPEADKKLIAHLKLVKLLIRLMKQLRDVQNWQFFCSYDILTVFLLELDNHPDPNHWHRAKLGIRFVEMLEKIRDIFAQQHLSFYYAPHANLLSHVKASTAENVANRLRRMILLIIQDPSCVWDFLVN